MPLDGTAGQLKLNVFIDLGCIVLLIHPKKTNTESVAATTDLGEDTGLSGERDAY